MGRDEFSELRITSGYDDPTLDIGGMGISCRLPRVTSTSDEVPLLRRTVTTTPPRGTLDRKKRNRCFRPPDEYRGMRANTTFPRSNVAVAAPMERRMKEGLSKKDVLRCLKRFIAREVFYDLKHDLLARPSSPGATTHLT